VILAYWPNKPKSLETQMIIKSSRQKHAVDIQQGTQRRNSRRNVEIGGREETQRSEVEKKAEPSLPCVLFLENGDDVLQGE
jgi:hypothetical protein